MRELDSYLAELIKSQLENRIADEIPSGITVNQILSTSDLITLLENKGFLATKSDPSYKNCTVSFRYSYAESVFLQIDSRIKVNLLSL